MYEVHGFQANFSLPVHWKSRLKWSHLPRLVSLVSTRSNRFNSSRGKIACCIYLLQLVVECYFLKGDICISEFEHDSKFGIWIDFLDERDVINAIMIKIQFDEEGWGVGEGKNLSASINPVPRMTRNSNGKKLVTVKKYRETDGVHPAIGRSKFTRRKLRDHPHRNDRRTIPFFFLSSPKEDRP